MNWILLAAVLLLACRAFWEYRRNRALQQMLSTVQSKQVSLEEQLSRQCERLNSMSQMRPDQHWQAIFFNQEAEFKKRLQAEYDKAVAAIDFDRVEYKKTITKKRREYSRRHKATKPQRDYRMIDDP